MRIKRYFYISLLLFLGLSFLLLIKPKDIFATTYYYVATNGDDSYTSTQAQNINTPWRTIQKAVNNAIAGDTVHIRGGTYSERVIFNARSGTQENYITFQAFPNEVPVINGAGISITPSAGLVDLRNVSYIKIDGLTINNSDDAGIYLSNCGNIIITNNHTNETNSSGIGVWNSNNILVDSNAVVNARNVTLENGGHEESISIASTTNFEVSNNNISLSGLTGYLGNAGIDVKGGSQFGKVHLNYIHDFPSEGVGIYLDAWDAVSPSLSNINIYANRINTMSHGIDIGSEMGGVVENVNIFNNIIYNVGSKGILVEDSKRGLPELKKDINIYNNTIFKARWNGGAGIYITASSIQNITIRNNIVYFNNWNGEIVAGDATRLSQIKADHNIVFGSKYCANDYPNCVEISDITDPVNYPNIHDNITADPKFVNGNAFDFHLLPDSLAIDSGLTIPNLLVDYDNIFRPQGLAYDIGVYEYQSNTTPTNIPTSAPVKPGDVDRDNDVDIIDFQLLGNTFGKSQGTAGYNDNADFIDDNVINIQDFVLLSNNFGR